MKAEMEVSVSVTTLVELIKDAEKAPKWISRVYSFENAEIISEYEWYTYSEVSIPWPFNDKDLVTYNILTYSLPDSSAFIESESKPEYIEEKEKRSRIKNYHGSWTFTPMENGNTQVVYKVYSQSSGGLPAWLVTPLVANGIHDTLQEMREQLEEVSVKNEEVRMKN